MDYKHGPTGCQRQNVPCFTFFAMERTAGSKEPKIVTGLEARMKKDRNPRMRQPAGREERVIDIAESDPFQFDKYDVGVRIPYVFTDVHMPFHPHDSPRCDIDLLCAAIGKYEAPPERRLRVQDVIPMLVLRRPVPGPIMVPEHPDAFVFQDERVFVPIGDKRVPYG
jgi:hypothetical protein